METMENGADSALSRTGRNLTPPGTLMTRASGTSDKFWRAHRLEEFKIRQMPKRRKISFATGISVQERDSNVSGTIVGRGSHPGEWVLALPNGDRIACLDVNLTATADVENQPTSVVGARTGAHK
jgi:hypothetical protein